MTAPPARCWIVGAGGLLGQSMARRLRNAPTFSAERFDWQSPDVEDHLRAEALRFMAEVGDADWVIAWCAGAGIIGTSREALRAETDLLSVVLATLRDFQPGILFLASSAGGVFGGSHDIPITEASATRPLSDYGMNKLAQEDIAMRWAEATGSRVLIGRLTNLYGPGQQIAKPQGLVTQVCLSTITRRPLSLYVSADNLRDYVFVDDASDKIARMIRRAPTDLPAGGHIVKVVGSGSSISIGGLLGEAHRVLGRRATYTIVRSSRASQQGTTLAFKSTVWTEIDDAPSTPLCVGIRVTFESLRHAVARVGVPS